MFDILKGTQFLKDWVYWFINCKVLNMRQSQQNMKPASIIY